MTQYTSMHARVDLAIRALVTAIAALIVAGLLLGLSSASAQPAPSPENHAQAPATAEAILDSMVEAIGGTEAWARLENQVLTGSFEQGGGRIPFTVYKGRPVLKYQISESDVYGKLESGTDGEVVWDKNPMAGARIKKGQQRDLELLEATFDALPNWRRHFNKVELVGVEQLDGKACYALRLISKTGVELTSYLDRETHLPVKHEIVLDLPEGKTGLVESWPSDYRAVDGILMPFVNRMKVADQVWVTSLEKIEHNVELPAGVFELPPDVRALIAGHRPPQGSGAPPASDDAAATSGNSYPVLTGQDRTRFLEHCGAPYRVSDRSIEVHWFKDGSTFWFEDSRGRHHVDPMKKEVRRLEDEAHARWQAERPRQQENRISAPGFDHYVMVKDGDLWLHREASEEGVQLTHDAHEDIAWRVTPADWSPDGQRLLALRVDAREVHHLPIIDYTHPEETVREVVYSKAGGSFMVRELAVFDLESTKRTMIDPGQEGDLYLFPLGWREDGSEVLFLRMTRNAKRLDLMAADPGSGESRTIVTEQQETFVGGLEFIRGTWRDCYTAIEGSDRFLWLSERSGWSHIYLYDLGGKLIRPLTEGSFPVQKVVAVDPEKGSVFFMANAEERLYDTHLYRTDLHGKGFTRLTEGTGEHEVQLSPSMEYFVDTHSSSTRPPVSELRSAQGELLLELSKADVSGLEAIAWTPPEEFIVKADDGTTDLYGVLFKPSGLDPDKRYPVIDFIYAGPFTTTVPNSYAPFSVMARRAAGMAQLGYVIFIVDGRGTTERGKAFQDASYGRIGQIEIPDHVAALRQLAAERPYMDLDRVGIYGGSWGGYFALRGMLTAPDVFRVGVAIAPGDLTEAQAINEPYMGLPEDNPDGFAAGSNPALAGNLQGRLLMIHGTADRNAPFSTTMRMASALVQAGKIHDLAVIPQADHHFRVCEQYPIERTISYFKEHLAGD